MESKEEVQAEEVEDEGPPPGYQTILPPPQPPSPPPPPPPQPPSSSPQRSCRASSNTVNRFNTNTYTNMVSPYSHQVGQVKCGSCTALMYPYGASQVRCSCYQFVTEIGAQNQRPPWSAQQGPPLRGLKPFPSTALFFAN